MSSRNLKEKLTLAPVGLEHLDQFIKLQRYVFQVTNEELQKSGYEEGELVRSKKPMLERGDVFGWFNDGELISQVCTYPCQVNIHNKVFNMGGLTGVGTYPEYTGMGLMNTLIRTALRKMRERKQWISYLYPYIIPYYRRKGWEIMSDHITYRIKDTQLPVRVEVPGYVERRAIDHPDVINTYDKFARQTHGALIRGPLDWNEYWRWENEDERIAAVYCKESGEPTGYVMYWIEDDIFHIKEMIYLDQETRRGLWNFIGAHFSMIDAIEGHIYKNEPLAFYLEDSQIVENIEPYYMARIVDVEAFLVNFPFTDFYLPFHFVLTDPLVEWNNGIFGVTGVNNGLNIVTREPAGQPVTTDIGTLTSMLMNYRRPTYFHELEHLSTDPDTLILLENIVPVRQPYFSDYY